MDSNHGELDRVTRNGSISRVIDISAVVGHVVPTALAFRRHLFISNLGLSSRCHAGFSRRALTQWMPNRYGRLIPNG
jgi:hypothetical protein